MVRQLIIMFYIEIYQERQKIAISVESARRAFFIGMAVYEPIWSIFKIRSIFIRVLSTEANL